MVCTANQCRSPLAEHLFRSAISASGLRWRVESAGTHASSGALIHPFVAQILDERGISTGLWHTRALSRPAIERADLVLTATEAQRGTVVRTSPKALRDTFSLLQFARIAGYAAQVDSPDGVAAGPALLHRVAAARGRLQPGRPQEWDIADPIGRPMRAFRICAETIDSAIAGIVSVI